MEPQKTEAMFFHGHREAPLRAEVRIAGEPIPVRAHIKYLGFTLNGHWSFVAHFERLTSRVEKAANNLSRLLPNLGGPSCRLFAGVVHSIAFYAVSVWIAEARASRRIQFLLRRAKRRVAQRVIKAYRTTSHVAATPLAGLALLKLLAEMYDEVYRQIRGLRRDNPFPPPRAKMVRLQV